MIGRRGRLWRVRAGDRIQPSKPTARFTRYALRTVTFDRAGGPQVTVELDAHRARITLSGPDGVKFDSEEVTREELARVRDAINSVLAEMDS